MGEIKESYMYYYKRYTEKEITPKSFHSIQEILVGITKGERFIFQGQPYFGAIIYLFFLIVGGSIGTGFLFRISPGEIGLTILITIFPILAILALWGVIMYLLLIWRRYTVVGAEGLLFVRKKPIFYTWEELVKGTINGLVYNSGRTNKAQIELEIRSKYHYASLRLGGLISKHIHIPELRGRMISAKFQSLLAFIIYAYRDFEIITENFTVLPQQDDIKAKILSTFQHFLSPELLEIEYRFPENPSSFEPQIKKVEFFDVGIRFPDSLYVTIGILFIPISTIIMLSSEKNKPKKISYSVDTSTG